MSDGQNSYKSFRQRLDAVLRQKDPAALRDFLVAEGQWQQGASTNAEAAMWMMIAASPNLGDLHDEARRWLLGNGHEAEVNAIFGRRGASGGAPRGGPRPAKAVSQGRAAGQDMPRRSPHSAQTPHTPKPQHSERHVTPKQEQRANPSKPPKRGPRER